MQFKTLIASLMVFVGSFQIVHLSQASAAPARNEAINAALNKALQERALDEQVYNDNEAAARPDGVRSQQRRVKIEVGQQLSSGDGNEGLTKYEPYDASLEKAVMAEVDLSTEFTDIEKSFAGTKGQQNKKN